MNITIRLDIPTNINDMTQGETAKLWLSLKKLQDELNMMLNSLDVDNLSESLRNRLSDIEQNTIRISSLEDDVAQIRKELTS